MNRSVLLIMGGAVIVAIFVAMLMQAKFSSKADVKSAPSTQILVANKKLSVGQKVKPEDVRWQAWPDAALFKGVFKKSDQKDEADLAVYKSPLRRNVEAGEPLTSQAIIPDGRDTNNFLAASIAPGMRAVAVAVKPDSSVGGFLSPGDYVDVIMSYSPRMEGDMREYAGEIVQRYASQTVLTNVKVLAVDQDSKDQERPAKVAKTVTIEVSKEGAEILALAESMGSISLALRRIGEKDEPTASMPLTTDMTTSNVMKKVANSVESAKTDADTVRLYSGTTIQNVPVRATSGP